MVDFVTSRREQILHVARRHGVTRVRVFGSMARGDAGPQSDIDLLIDVGAEPSPWFPGGFVADLEELLGRRVQVVTEHGLDALLRDRVLQEAEPILSSAQMHNLRAMAALGRVEAQLAAAAARKKCARSCHRPTDRKLS